MYGIKEFTKSYSKHSVRYDMSNLLDWISYTLKISDPDNIPNFGYHGDTPLGDTWGIVYAYAPNVATLLDDSNWEAMIESFNELDSDSECWHIEYFSSWTTGTENLMIQLITDDGIPTQAAKLAYSLLTRLDNYPVLDEDDYSKRVYDAEFESIKEYIRYSDLDTSTLPDNHIGLIWESLWESNVQSDEGYFSEGDIESAIADLGWSIDSGEDTD